MEKKELITIHDSFEEVKEVLERVKECPKCLGCGKLILVDSDHYFAYHKQYETLYYCSKKCVNEFDFGDQN